MLFIAVRTLFTFVPGAAEHLVQKSCDLEEHLPQKEQLLLKLLAKLLAEILQLLQRPVMIDLTGLWLVTDGRATAESRLSQLHVSCTPEAACGAALPADAAQNGQLRLIWASCRSQTLGLGQLAPPVSILQPSVCAHRAVRLEQVLSLGSK